MNCENRKTNTLMFLSVFLLKQLINKKDRGQGNSIHDLGYAKMKQDRIDTVLSLRYLKIHYAKVSGTNYNTIRNEEKAYLKL